MGKAGIRRSINRQTRQEACKKNYGLETPACAPDRQNRHTPPPKIQLGLSTA
jgi:hypothetical protein